ncbi:DsbA family oxidoreductase [Alphaproteobacteria bacterium]|nr:DsbA family oxidoreductase [Alphaproteobacteria bacterium]
MSNSYPILHLDIISDFICPWCFIGKRKLDRALGNVSGFQINLAWRPFRLDPTIADEGEDRKEYLTRKFGAPKSKKFASTVQDAAAGTDIQFAFDKITRTPNTLNAHRLVRWSGEYGLQHAIADDLFSAYFEHGKDIGDFNTLIEIGVKYAMDETVLRAKFASNEDVSETRQLDAQARGAGVTGVPAFLMGGKFLLVGAQEPEYLNQIFSKAVVKLANPGHSADTPGA